jgi:hypothetical protein
MPKFRKKPAVIEAEQFLEGQPIPKGVCFGWHCGDTASKIPHVHTTHNNQRVDVVFGDWIIPEPNGSNFYPCKPDIFKATYEPLEVLKKRPTIVELEEMLKRNDLSVSVNPDGSVCAVKTP